MKIAVSGSAGGGKTTLVGGLSRTLGIPSISEEMRDYMVFTERDLLELSIEFLMSSSGGAAKAIAILALHSYAKGFVDATEAAKERLEMLDKIALGGAA